MTQGRRVFNVIRKRMHTDSFSASFIELRSVFNCVRLVKNNGASQRTRNSLRQEMKVIWMMRGKLPEVKPLALLIRRGAWFIATVVTIHPAQTQETKLAESSVATANQKV